jgi:hypothetical protein
MKVLLDVENPVIWQNEINRQKRLREKIETRWANMQNKKPIQGENNHIVNKSEIFGFHF